MKTKIALFVLCAVLPVTMGLAKYIIWQPQWRPPILLADALEIAAGELKKEKKDDYYCVAARVGRAFSEADWELQYANEKGKLFWINVCSDKTVRKSESGFEY